MLFTLATRSYALLESVVGSIIQRFSVWLFVKVSNQLTQAQKNTSDFHALWLQDMHATQRTA